jgi:hypothetical protein
MESGSFKTEVRAADLPHLIGVTKSDMISAAFPPAMAFEEKDLFPFYGIAKNRDENPVCCMNEMK